MLQQIRTKFPAVFLAVCMALSLSACGNTEDKASSSEASSKSAQSDSSESDAVPVATDTNADNSDDTAEPVTESDPADMNYQLDYDSNVIPDAMAKTIATYFYAIETQNYDLYTANLDSDYQTATEKMLQEQYGYGLETSMEMYHQSLINAAGTDDCSITAIEMSMADEALAANYDADTDFVEEYLSAFTQVLGENFTTQLKQDTDALYDVVLNITGENSSGEAISIMSDLEILVTERGDVYGVMG
ncbi:hypothetical protein [uncultured Ruminococcus sp.]|uniref:hypothetical protein n=1 Tax=uncultured Ruminococcus sp. TaxID=165186 RepID=UPI0025F56BE7|nr:hypothetical protein [uncultured Ruminococcus sp.]